jgi:capsular polysaccharide transport system permease protein
MNAVIKTIAIVVGIPTLIASIYFGLIASDIYVSEARFAIRSAKSGGSSGGLAAILASPIASGGTQDTQVVADYVQSQDMLNKISERLDIRGHYSDTDIDVLARLDEDATREQALDYFSQQVNVLRDSGSDVVTLQVRAFNPETAQQITQQIIELSESLVNNMSNRIEEDALATARAEVDRAALKVQRASSELTSFRNTNASLNPAEESSALMGIVAGLEGRLIESRADLSEKEAFMKSDSPAIVSLRNRVNALSRQLRLEKGRLVGGEEGQQLSGLIEDYQPLALSRELAQLQYTSALSSLEIARLEAQRKKQYIVTFIAPSLPDEAVQPRRFMEVLTVMVFSFLLYLVGGLMWSALKDHVSK